MTHRFDGALDAGEEGADQSEIFGVAQSGGFHFAEHLAGRLVLDGGGGGGSDAAGEQAYGRPQAVSHDAAHDGFEGAALEEGFDHFLFVAFDLNGAQVFRDDYVFTETVIVADEILCQIGPFFWGKLAFFLGGGGGGVGHCITSLFTTECVFLSTVTVYV